MSIFSKKKPKTLETVNALASAIASVKVASQLAGAQNASALVSAHAAQNAAYAMSTLGANSPSTIGSFPGVTGVPYGMAALPQVDPLVYATRVHMSQPSDKRWRRFEHVLFLAEHVMSVYSSGGSDLNIHLGDNKSAGAVHNFTLPFDCDDPVQWFAEHVLNLEFPDNHPSQ